MTTHFTAVVKVTKVVDPFTETKQYNEKIDHPREVTDITEVVIRADTLVSMKTKLAAHIELVSEA